MSSKSKGQLPALTGIRFFLALWIVIYHQLPPLESVLNGSLLHGAESILNTGYIAVTAFFVLSGFVLAYNYDLGRIASSVDRLRFASARFSRIYPAYLIGMLLLVPFGLYRLRAGIQMLPPWIEWGGLALNVTLLQSWIPQTALTWNYPGWSLSNEAFFYACFPFVGAMLWRIKPLSVLWTMLAALWILSCAAPLLAVLAPAHHWGMLPATTHDLPVDASIWANIIRYNPLLRLPEFCAGILLGKVYAATSDRYPDRNGAWLYVPAMVIIVLVLLTADRIPYPLLHNGLLLPLFASMVLGLAIGGGLFAQWLSRRTLVFLGNASYCMYILHVPTYAWLGLFFRYVLHSPATGWFWFFSYVAAVIALSSLLFKYIEEPWHRKLRAKLNYWLVPTLENAPV
jgi:peptidoglycan/LPS O-acetylase OafA/YrhL